MYDALLQFIRALYGEPARPVPLHQPCFAGNEKAFLVACIDSTFVSSVGPFVDQFEEVVAAYTGSEAAVACVNGTCALFLALRLAGVQDGDEVITQPLTFVATVNAIAWSGALPVFIDVDKDTLGMSPGHLREWLGANTEMDKTGVCRNRSTGKRVAACVPMHTFGHPCRVDEISKVCQDYNVRLVEDAAESLGSFYKGRHTGTFGDVGVLSFNGNKVITTGGGGMLLFRDSALAIRARHLTTQAKVPHPWFFSHDESAYNFRLPNVNAALGCAQMERLVDILASKRRIAHAYRDFLATGEIGDFVPEPSDAQSNYWLNTILMQDVSARDDLLECSNCAGINTRPAWNLMHTLPMYAHCARGDLSNAVELYSRVVNLPSSSLISAL